MHFFRSLVLSFFFELYISLFRSFVRYFFLYIDMVSFVIYLFRCLCICFAISVGMLLCMSFFLYYIRDFVLSLFIVVR